MSVYCRGIATIRHKDSRNSYEIQSHELDWQAVQSEERGMGPETHYEAHVEHPELGLLSWSVWEYPVGAENARQTSINNHILVRDFDYGFETTP